MENLLFQLSCKIMILCYLIIIISSCSKTVYVHKDDLGESRYIIYSDNYKYIEKSRYANFHMWGKYEIKNDTIYFDVTDIDRIPYTYCTEGFTKLPNNHQSEFIHLTVVDITNFEPVILAYVFIKDSLHRVISAVQTDLEGRAMLRKAPDCSYIDIDYIGYSKFRLDYQKFRNNNILIEMEQLDAGGLWTENCLRHQTGATLKYKRKEFLKHSILEKNGIVYLSKE